MKLIHAFWGERDIASDLLDASLRADLAAAGVRRLQINLDDADIADTALRLHTGDPITAVVSTWLDGPAAPVTQALAALAARTDGTPHRRLAGWRVEERVPMAPPEVADGARADALANVAFLRRPPELSHEAWIAHWHGPHTTVAVETQATFGYLQNVVLEAVTADAPPVDGIVEELFPPAAVDDIHAFYGSGGDAAELDRRITRLMTSVAAFGADRDLDLVPTSRYLFTLASAR